MPHIAKISPFSGSPASGFLAARLVVRLALPVAVGLGLACRPTAPVVPSEPVPVGDPEPVAPTSPVPVAAPETWVGSVKVMGTDLDIAVAFTPDPDNAGRWQARLDIPMQGIKDFPLKDVELAADSLEFTFAPPGASEAQMAIFVAEREPGAATATGELLQNRQSYPLTLRRLGPGESLADLAPQRPQEPKPPFPYTVRDVTVTSPVDGVNLAGTFTAPNDGARHPAVVLLSGSGAQDRDEALMGHKPFMVLADHLTRNGIAVVRFDDRGIGGSGGRLDETPHSTQHRDASAALAWLQQQPEVDPTRVGLVGHSEGANIAMLAAAADRNVGFIVLLAGMGVSGQEILPMQMAAMLRASGVPEDAIKEVVALEQRLLTAVIKSAPKAEQETMARELTRRQLEATKTSLSPEQFEALVQSGLAAFASPAFQSLLRHDPRPVLKKLKTTPVLALNGTLDLQVPASENLGEITKALQAAKNRDVTVHSLPGLNHLFQTATIGTMEEYRQITETFAPAALDLVSRWILERKPNPAKR